MSSGPENAGKISTVIAQIAGTDYFIRGECACGEFFNISNPAGWRWMWMGAMEFQCPKCRKVMRVTKNTMMG
jgi:trimethylamine:corrinoid methyltransferase-like protein